MSARRRGRSARLALAAAMALALTLGGANAAKAPPPATPAPSSSREIPGFGEATFGMRWEAVRALYPQARELTEGENRGAPSIGGPFVRRLLLSAQPVPGFSKPADIELRFWKNALWTVVMYFGDEPDPSMVAVLSARLGPSDNGDPDNPQWGRARTQTTAAVKQRWFAVNDLVLSGDAQAWFIQVMRGEWKGPSQAELDTLREPTPAPTAR